MAEDVPSLLDLARSRVRPKTPQCSLWPLLNTELGPQIQQLIDNTGKDERGQPRGEGLPFTVSAATISEAAKVKLDHQVISRHIRRVCNCPQ
jgi:hypothetical protein